MGLGFLEGVLESKKKSELRNENHYEQWASMAEDLSSDTSIQLIICLTLDKLSNQFDLTFPICKMGIIKPTLEGSHKN